MSENRPGLTPVEILQSYYRAMNAGKVDEALALFAEDAIRLDSAAPERLVQGKAQIGKGIAARIADHIAIEAHDYQVQGNVVTCIAKASTDYGRRLGFAPVEEAVEVT